MTTAISTAVSTVVASAFKWGGGLLTRFRARLAPDHHPLHAGDWALPHSFDGSARFRIFVACAPDRSRKQTEIDPDKAIEFVRAAFSEYANAEPRRSLPQSGIKFEATSPDPDVPHVWVWTGGRVDYSTFVDAIPTPDGGRTLAITAILQPILTMTRATTCEEYAKVFPRRGLRRRRLDWFITVSTNVRSADHQSLPWTALTFPGRSPDRAGDQMPYCPQEGYGRKALTSWRPHRPTEELVAAFLDSFLKQNGYHNCDAAIEDVCDAAI